MTSPRRLPSALPYGSHWPNLEKEVKCQVTHAYNTSRKELRVCIQRLTPQEKSNLPRDALTVDINFDDLKKKPVMCKASFPYCGQTVDIHRECEQIKNKHDEGPLTALLNFLPGLPPEELDLTISISQNTKTKPLVEFPLWPDSKMNVMIQSKDSGLDMTDDENQHDDPSPTDATRRPRLVAHRDVQVKKFVIVSAKLEENNSLKIEMKPCLDSFLPSGCDRWFQYSLPIEEHCGCGKALSPIHTVIKCNGRRSAGTTDKDSKAKTLKLSEFGQNFDEVKYIEYNLKKDTLDFTLDVFHEQNRVKFELAPSGKMGEESRPRQMIVSVDNSGAQESYGTNHLITAALREIQQDNGAGSTKRTRGASLPPRAEATPAYGSNLSHPPQQVSNGHSLTDGIKLENTGVD